MPGSLRFNIPFDGSFAIELAKIRCPMDTCSDWSADLSDFAFQAEPGMAEARLGLREDQFPQCPNGGCSVDNLHYSALMTHVKTVCRFKTARCPQCRVNIAGEAGSYIDLITAHVTTKCSALKVGDVVGTFEHIQKRLAAMFAELTSNAHLFADVAQRLSVHFQNVSVGCVGVADISAFSKLVALTEALANKVEAHPLPLPYIPQPLPDNSSSSGSHLMSMPINVDAITFASGAFSLSPPNPLQMSQSPSREPLLQ